jgi:hypothetical protein
LTDTLSALHNDDFVFDFGSQHWSVKGRPPNSRGFLPELPREAAYTHIGLYLGWAIERGRVSQGFLDEHAGDVAAVKDKRLSGPQLVARLGGELRASMLDDELARFTRLYYAKGGRFFPDYTHTFMGSIVQARSMYVVADTRENQARLSARLDERLGAWRAYPPAARRIFGEEVGVGSYQDLETVTQMALLVAAKALKLARTCKPIVVFLTPSDEVRVPQVLSHRGRNIEVMAEEGVMAAAECLREGLRLGTVKAFAAARLRTDESATPASGVEVIAQQRRSGPHRVFAPYTLDVATGALAFESPLVATAQSASSSS